MQNILVVEDDYDLKELRELSDLTYKEFSECV